MTVSFIPPGGPKFIPMPKPFRWNGDWKVTIHDDGRESAEIKMELDGAIVWLPITPDILMGMVAMMKQTQGDRVPWSEGDTLVVDRKSSMVHAKVGEWETLVT